MTLRDFANTGIGAFLIALIGLVVVITVNFLLRLVF